MKLLKTSQEWLDILYPGTIVMDPDGWDRKNFEKNWNEKINKEEFEKRLCYSTCIMKNK